MPYMDPMGGEPMALPEIVLEILSSWAAGVVLGSIDGRNL